MIVDNGQRIQKLKKKNRGKANGREIWVVPPSLSICFFFLFPTIKSGSTDRIISGLESNPMLSRQQVQQADENNANTVLPLNEKITTRDHDLRVRVAEVITFQPIQCARHILRRQKEAGAVCLRESTPPKQDRANPPPRGGGDAKIPGFDPTIVAYTACTTQYCILYCIA